MTALTAVAQAITTDDDEPRPCACGAVDQLLKLPKVAEHLDIALPGVYRLINAGELPAVDLPGCGVSRSARRRVRTSALRAFIDRLAAVEPRTA